MKTKAAAAATTTTTIADNQSATISIPAQGRAQC